MRLSGLRLSPSSFLLSWVAIQKRTATLGQPETREGFKLDFSLSLRQISERGNPQEPLLKATDALRVSSPSL